jgi:hypothetical protein
LLEHPPRRRKFLRRNRPPCRTLPSRQRNISLKSRNSSSLHDALLSHRSLCWGSISNRFPRSSEAMIVLASLFIFIRTILLSTLPTSPQIPHVAHGAEVFIGLGFGILGAVSLFILQDNVHFSNLASAMGVKSTCNFMGGCIAVAMCSAISHSDLLKGARSNGL